MIGAAGDVRQAPWNSMVSGVAGNVARFWQIDAGDIRIDCYSERRFYCRACQYSFSANETIDRGPDKQKNTPFRT
jgi:hypothetical protein